MFAVARLSGGALVSVNAVTLHRTWLTLDGVMSAGEQTITI